MASEPDVVVNDLLCFVANYASVIPRSELRGTVERHFDADSVKVARKVLGEEEGELGDLLDEAVKAQAEGRLCFAATNLCALPLVVKMGAEAEESMLVKILAEVQSLRRLVTELKGGSLSPNPSSTDGADGGGSGCREEGTGSGCTNRSGSSPSIPNTEGTVYSSPESPSSRWKRKSGSESAQGGASLEDTVERLKQKKSRGFKKPLSRDEKSPNDESKFESSLGGGNKTEEKRRDRMGIPLENVAGALPRATVPFLHIPNFPNGYTHPLQHPGALNAEMFSQEASGHHNNFLRAWFALHQVLHQAHSHNLSQGSTLFPQISNPPMSAGAPSPLLKTEHCEKSLSPVSLISPTSRNGLLGEGGGNLKAECSEEGSPLGNEISVDMNQQGDLDDDYPSPDEEEGTQCDRNPGEWKGLLNDAIDKPYVCQHVNCQKRFANKFLLKKHEFIHTGERPHQCPFCMKRFNRKDNLLRHKKTHLANAISGMKRRHTLVFGVGDAQTAPPQISLAHQLKQEESPGDASAGRNSIPSVSSSCSVNTSPTDQISIP